MFAANRRDAVRPRLLAGDPPVPVVVVPSERIAPRALVSRGPRSRPNGRNRALLDNQRRRCATGKHPLQGRRLAIGAA